MTDQQTENANAWLDEHRMDKPTTPETEALKEPTLLDMDDMATSSREKDDDFVFEDDLFGTTENLPAHLEAIDQDVDFQIWLMENLNKPMTEVPPQLQQLTPVEMARLLIHTSSWIIMLEGDHENTDDPDEAIIAYLKNKKAELASANLQTPPGEAFPSLAGDNPAEEAKPIIPEPAFTPLAGSEYDQPADAAPAPVIPKNPFQPLV